MAFTSLTSLLADACAGGYAVGYFEAWDAYSLEAVIEAAEAEQAPVVLGFGCLMLDQSWLDAGGIETLGCLGRCAAERAGVPVSLLLNEAHTLQQALSGIDAGFNAVMLHSSDPDSIRQLVRVAHDHGVAVEGELGTLPTGTVDGEIDRSGASLTDPEEAARFVSVTGVDCLAVSFGNVHTLENRFASVDLDRLEAIQLCVKVPLVVHGGTGYPAEAVAGAIDRGVAKFNVGTVLKRSFLDGLRAAVMSAPADASPHDLLGSHNSADLLNAGKSNLVGIVRRLIRLYGASGRASFHTQVGAAESGLQI
jgi:ketose-bisphosphate aldolase